MSPAQTKQFAAIAQMLIALGEQVNRMTDSMIRLNERVEKLEEATKPKATEWIGQPTLRPDGSMVGCVQ